MTTLWLLLVAALSPSQAAEKQPGTATKSLPSAATRQVDFARDVFAVLESRCFACHGPDEQEAELRLDARAIAKQGGVSGKLFEPGDSADSLLVHRMAGLGDEEQMPPGEDPLTDEQIGLVRAWIDQGAKWPDGVGSSAQQLERHWAYVAPQRPAPPQLKDDTWSQGAIDRFVLAKMREQGLQPSPPAERARLLRRVSLDLTGLPPTIAELDAFLADRRPDAYLRAVDRLLESPRYGERWARLWLDLARYADSNGYQADQFRDVWPYRDWVIDALNADMPYDQFTIEQIAGDLLPRATVDQKIASGFHRLTTCNVEAGVDPEENRVNQVLDRVNVTGTVWLGTSIECAQCHNHKYDPFTQRDYYGLFAFFNNTPLEVKLGGGTRFDFVGPKMTLPLDAEQAERRKALVAQKQKLTARRAEIAGQLAAQPQVAQNEKADTPVWKPLEVVAFESAEGATHKVLEDQSVLVTGKNPDKDTYTVTVRSDLAGIRAFKLEALLDESLPGGGPGRQLDRARGNYVLNELSLETTAAATAGASAQQVPLVSARADYENPQYKATDALDGDRQTGWAIHQEYHKPHHLICETPEPVGAAGGTTLVFRLEQLHGGQRTLGRFRLLASADVPRQVDMPADVTQALAKLPAKRTKKEAQAIRDYFVGRDARIAQLDTELKQVEQELTSLDPDTTLVMVEMDQPRETRVFRRGNFLDPGAPVAPATPRSLHDWRSEFPADRIGLARWLVDRENPLTARVAVNRWWAEIFGGGIVASTEDFGTQGEPATHPELLDWLAVELMESGWSRKHILRLIVTSATYRQSAKMSGEALERDPNNKWLARGPRFRLSAEAIRDSGLVASGLLSTKMGGPPIFPPQPAGVWRHVGRNAPVYRTSQDEDRFRRGIYVVWRRSAPYASFVNFDAPDRAAACIRRPRTNTPLQALTLLNDDAYVEMALALADRVLNDLPDGDAAQRVNHAFRCAVSRRPTAQEVEQLVSLYERERARLEKQPQLAKALVSAKPRNVQASDVELAAWFFVTNVLLNLDETITK